MRPSHCFTSHN